MSRQILEFPPTKVHENPHTERRPVLRRQADEQMDKAMLHSFSQRACKGL